MISQLRNWANSTPADLRETRWDFTEEVMKDTPLRQLALKLWLAAAAKCADRVGNRYEEITIAQLSPKDASVLADRFVGESGKTTDFGRAKTRAARQLSVDQGEKGSEGPGAEVAGAGERTESIEQIRRYRAVFGRVNILRSRRH